MVEIVWTAEAVACIHEIHDHVAADSPEAASRVLKGIVSRVEQLKAFPDSGAWVDLAEIRNLRMLLYGHYRIVYRRSTPDRIEVIGVYHDALDVARRLTGAGRDSVNE